ncbi:hypothetical protein, partial [Methylobacterium variabile]|uniref:hypothetical protein n=1 Tax=Methylobacterium variabile TaxID=298794 RepID=UPI000B15FDC5
PPAPATSTVRSSPMNLIHTALDLYGIRHAGRDRNRSLLSATYRDKARFCDGLPGAPEAVDPAKVARAE